MCLRLVVLAAPPIVVVAVVSCSCCCYVSYAVLSFVTHAHTHTEQARRQAADSGQRIVESRVSPLLAMDCPGAMQSSQGCPELLHTHEHMQVCICVSECVSLPGGRACRVMSAASCGQLLSPFCPLASGNIYRTSTLDEQRVANDFNSRLRLLASRI